MPNNAGNPHKRSIKSSGPRPLPAMMEAVAMGFWLELIVPEDDAQDQRRSLWFEVPIEGQSDSLWVELEEPEEGVQNAVTTAFQTNSNQEIKVAFTTADCKVVGLVQYSK